MFTTIHHDSADEVWKSAASKLLDPKQSIHTKSRDGLTVELPRAAITVLDPLNRWVVSRTPAINVAFTLAEIVWIMAGRRDSHFLTFFNGQLAKFQGHGGIFHGAYGDRLRRQFIFDQIDRAYCALSANPETRQVVLQIWNGERDFPSDGGEPASRDVPCNIVSMLKVRDGKLYWTQIMRSNDLKLGLPQNIVQFTYLQEILAGWLDLELGSYNHLSDSLHVYQRDLEDIKNHDQNVTPASNDDRMKLSKPESENLFAELSGRVDLLVSHDLKKAVLHNKSKWLEAPISFQNILRVLAAESARRNKWVDTSKEIMDGCTNPCYNQLWERWLDQVQKNRELAKQKKGSS